MLKTIIIGISAGYLLLNQIGLMARGYEPYKGEKNMVDVITLTIDNKSSHRISFTSQSLNTNVGMGGTVSQGTYFSSIEKHTKPAPYKSAQWAPEGIARIGLLDMKKECLLKLNAEDRQNRDDAMSIINWTDQEALAYPCPWLKYSIEAKPVKMYYSTKNATFLYYDYTITVEDK